MESEKYLEGQSMQRPPLFESDGFIYWKNRFETYVKSKDPDLWHVITYGDFPPIQYNPETKKDETLSFDKQNDDLKKKLAKNNEAKMVIYNALPHEEDSLRPNHMMKEKVSQVIKTDNSKGERIIVLIGDSITSSESVHNYQKLRSKRPLSGGSWSDSDEDEEVKDIKTKICLLAKASNGGSSLKPNS
ncbi:hypothetical protein Tco_0565340 [Tanacetum coccineum]